MPAFPSQANVTLIYRQKEPLCRYQPAERLSTLEAHTGLLQQVFKEAAKRLLIVSPFISIRAIEHDNLIPQMWAAVERGVEVVVYSDSRLDYNGQTGLLREEADAGRKALVENGAKLVLLKGIHIIRSLRSLCEAPVCPSSRASSLCFHPSCKAKVSGWSGC